MADVSDLAEMAKNSKDKVDSVVTTVLEKGVANQVRKLPGGSLIADRVASSTVSGAKKDPKKAAKLGRMLARG